MFNFSNCFNRLCKTTIILISIFPLSVFANWKVDSVPSMNLDIIFPNYEEKISSIVGNVVSNPNDVSNFCSASKSEGLYAGRSYKLQRHYVHWNGPLPDYFCEYTDQFNDNVYVQIYMVPTKESVTPKPSPKPEPKPSPLEPDKPKPKPEPEPDPKPDPDSDLKKCKSDVTCSMVASDHCKADNQVLDEFHFVGVGNFTFTCKSPAPTPKPEPKPDPKPDPKPEPKPEPKPDPKPDPKPEPKPKPDTNPTHDYSSKLGDINSNIKNISNSINDLENTVNSSIKQSSNTNSNKLDNINSSINNSTSAIVDSNIKLSNILDEVKKGNKDTKIGSSSCDKFVCDGSSYECFLGRQMWESNCNTSKLLDEIAGNNVDSDGLINSITSTTSKNLKYLDESSSIDIKSQLNKYDENNGISFGTSYQCPEDIHINYFAGKIDIPLTPFCDIADIIRFIVIMFSSISATLLVLRSL